MAERLYALFYEYVEDVVEKRGPYREAHLDLIGRWHDDDRVAMGGALGDPPHGGLIVFRVDDPPTWRRSSPRIPTCRTGSW